MTSVQLYQGDCLEVMQRLPVGSVDAVICDLPYGTTACSWDTVIPFVPLWDAYKRLVKPNGAIVLFGSQPFTSLLVCSNLKWFKYAWSWMKNRPSGKFHAKNAPMKQHEDICIFSEGTNVHASQSDTRMTYNPQGLKDCSIFVSGKTGQRFYGDRPSNIRRYEMKQTGYPCSVIYFDEDENPIHPTQKPVSLLSYLVQTYTNEGETILDNTMGSGTTGVACVQTLRNFIGIESDERYFCIAQKRIGDAQAQGNLFEIDPE